MNIKVSQLLEILKYKKERINSILNLEKEINKNKDKKFIEMCKEEKEAINNIIGAIEATRRYRDIDMQVVATYVDVEIKLNGCYEHKTKEYNEILNLIKDENHFKRTLKIYRSFEAELKYGQLCRNF